MAAEQTTHYHLSKWADSDRILRADFNSDNTAIDTALHTLDGKCAALETAVAALGNCCMEVKTYTGTGDAGAEHPVSITFAHQPALLIVMGNDAMALAWQGQTSAISAGFSSDLYLVWDGTTVRWYHSNATLNPMNTKNKAYRAFAFYTL